MSTQRREEPTTTARPTSSREEANERQVRDNRRFRNWVVAPLAGAVLLVGFAVQAESDVRELLAPPVVLTSPRDPKEFLADLEPGRLRPVVVLEREDAVADVLCRRSRTLSQTDALRVAQAVNEEAASLGFDPLLLLAVIHIESYYNHLAISPVGAEGLMQLMPPTAEWMANRDGLDWSDHHSFDPILNVRLGSRYLALLMEEFGDLEHALTAYNRGPSATHYILNHHDALPESVREGYSTPVIERYEKLRRTYGHLPAAADLFSAHAR